MADISTISVNGTSYNIKDATARNRLVPTGGTAGQVLVKNSATNGDCKWDTLNIGPSDNQNWYLPTGLATSNVIAAYKFVGASSEDNALKNVVNASTCPLYNSGAIWNASTGFYFDNTLTKCEIRDWNQSSSECTINGASLSATIKSVVFGYRYATTPTNSQSSIGCCGKNLLYTRAWQGTTNYITYPAVGTYTEGTYLYKSAIEYKRGVLGGNFISSTSFNIYLNGMNIPLTAHSTKINLSNHDRYTVLGFQSARDSATKVPAYATAIVYYNVALTNAQHMELYHNIVALGGGLD